MMLTVSITWNSTTLNVTYSSFETMILKPEEMIDNMSLKSIGYYRTEYGDLQQNIGRYFRFQSADVLYEQFIKFVTILQREKDETDDKTFNTWLRMMKREMYQIGRHKKNI